MILRQSWLRTWSRYAPANSPDEKRAQSGGVSRNNTIEAIAIMKTRAETDLLADIDVHVLGDGE